MIIVARMDNSNFNELCKRMPLYKRISLFLKTGHYVFWKITVMDLTIIVPLFVLLGFALERATALAGPMILLTDGAVCGVILYFRIRFRRLKACRYILEKAEQTDRLFRSYAEMVEREGDDEDRRLLAEMAEKMRAIRDLVELMADVAYKEDVLGFRENEDE